MARILILEDQVELAKTWQVALTSEGHTVRTVTTYSDFEAAFQAEKIELMIVDLSLAEDKGDSSYSGLVALSDNLLRTTLRGQKVPCIVASGHFSQAEADDPLRQRVLPFNPDKIFAKPFEIKKLMDAVKELTAE